MASPGVRSSQQRRSGAFSARKVRLRPLHASSRTAAHLLVLILWASENGVLRQLQRLPQHRRNMLRCLPLLLGSSISKHAGGAASQNARRSTVLSPVARGSRGGPLGASHSDRLEGWQPLTAISDMDPQVS